MNEPSIGTWRTYATLPVSQLYGIGRKDGLSKLQVGALAVNPCTAFRLLKDFVPLQRGDWFVQNGANSGVGRAAIQFARLWGLNSINVVRNRPGVEALKEELRGLGASRVVTDDEIAASSMRDMADEWTSGKGVALGLNCVGGKNTANVARMLAPGGHLVTYGAMARQPVSLPASLYIFKDIHTHGFWVTRWMREHPDEKSEMLEAILDTMRTQNFRDTPMQPTLWPGADEPDDEVWARLSAAVSRAISGGEKQVFTA
jgi:trans-2-enoyl-CoA reductase